MPPRNWTGYKPVVTAGVISTPGTRGLSHAQHITTRRVTYLMYNQEPIVWKTPTFSVKTWEGAGALLQLLLLLMFFVLFVVAQIRTSLSQSQRAARLRGVRWSWRQRGKMICVCVCCSLCLHLRLNHLSFKLTRSE